MDTIYLYTTIMSPILTVDFATLCDYESRKLIKHATHPIYDLHIWNYAESVQYSRQWDDITTMCRGLITDGTGRIIARSFKKFFNMEELDAANVATLAATGYDVAEKMDGSLGILFYYAPENKWFMTSRGSFISDQAKMGEKILYEKAGIGGVASLNKDWSYVFEIIYPENKIVVDYGAQRDIILLAIIDNVTGCELPLTMTAPPIFTTVRHLTADTFTALKAKNAPNEEGYVIRFHDADNTRMKIKFETYCALHRMTSNITVKAIYQMARDGTKPLSELMETVPDEFMDWFEKVYTRICALHDKILADATNTFTALGGTATLRRDFANAIKSNPMATLLFAIYNGFTGDKLRTHIFDKYMSHQDIEKEFPIESTTYCKKYQHDPLLIVLVGISGSGKTTWATKKVKEASTNTVSVSRDQIRRQLFCIETSADITGYYNGSRGNVSANEDIVTDVQMRMITSALKNKKTVIVDNLNLQQRVIVDIVKTAAAYIDITTNFIIKLFGVGVGAAETAKAIESRPYNNVITAATIQKQIDQWNALTCGGRDDAIAIQTKIIALYVNRIVITGDPQKPPCYIFDIDGTLALHCGRRDIFDWSRVGLDDVNEPVRHTLQLVRKSGIAVIICSGRNQCAAANTEKWCRVHGIEYDEIHFRADGVTEKDWMTKERMWADISTRYNIVAIYDDRDQVVDHARDLGYTVYQVNYGDF